MGLAFSRLLLGTLVLLTHGITLAAEENQLRLAGLGKALFFDANLSKNRSQSCATCHDPAHAFTDGRHNLTEGAVSLGDDAISLGDRNALTTTYAASRPPFHANTQGDFVGGFFYDGRAATLFDQAAEPFTNPLEMGMASPAAVVERVRENPEYVATLETLYGDTILADSVAAFEKIVAAIVEFERTEQFAPYDSKYDRYLRGTYEMTGDEEVGRILFFSQLTNCSNCHLLRSSPLHTKETFTNYRYHNIGTPVNTAVRLANGYGRNHVDMGLLANAAVDDPLQAGKYRVPTLRNVAVTGPYMHNGVFKELRTAVLFYGKYTLNSERSQLNPETNERWRPPEVGATVDLALLRPGQPIGAARADALVAFLETLTDKRYEALLAKRREQPEHR